MLQLKIFDGLNENPPILLVLVVQGLEDSPPQHKEGCKEQNCC